MSEPIKLIMTVTEDGSPAIISPRTGEPLGAIFLEGVGPIEILADENYKFTTMKTLTPKPKKKIKAEITNNFFDIVDRLFDNTPRTVIAELIQNSRRAGATKLQIDFEHEEQGMRMMFKDNGKGIDDMAKLLHIRSSGWDASTMTKEDPAGMGFFCLCRMRELTVKSKNSSAFMGANCEALRGLIEVPVMELEEFVDGTEISFVWPDVHAYQIREAIIDVGRFAPLSIMVEGNEIERKPFRPIGCLDEFETDDVIVYIHRRSYSERLDFNFHGLTVADSFDNDIESYAVAIDVKDTRNLQMVLPARNAIVRNEFYKELITEIRRRIYTLIANENCHHLPYRNWEEAIKLGVNLPPAAASLHDICSERPLDENKICVLMDQTRRRGKFETLSTAMDDDGTYKLYATNALMEGYGWYDELSKVTDVKYLIGDEAACLTGTSTAIDLSLRVVLDYETANAFDLPARVLIGLLAYGDDNYIRSVERARGFVVDPRAKWDEKNLCDLIDHAWLAGYATDSARKEWNRQRTADVRRRLVGSDNALEFALKAAMEDALTKTTELINYAGNRITLQCVIDDQGGVVIERL